MEAGGSGSGQSDIEELHSGPTATEYAKALFDSLIRGTKLSNELPSAEQHDLASSPLLDSRTSVDMLSGCRSASRFAPAVELRTVLPGYSICAELPPGLQMQKQGVDAGE